MRLLWGLTIVLALAAGYFGVVRRSSYSGFSKEKLLQLADGYRAQLRQPDPVGEESAVSLSLLQDELLRRRLAPALSIVAGLALLGTLFLTFRLRARPRKLTGEDARLQAAFGDPAVLEAGARQKAAALLGVTVDAPLEVVLAAYEAQRNLYARERLEGLPGDLHRMLQEKLVEFEKARDLLVAARTRH